MTSYEQNPVFTFDRRKDLAKRSISLVIVDDTYTNPCYCNTVVINYNYSK